MSAPRASLLPSATWQEQALAAAEQALAAAEREGLELVTSEGHTGYKGVRYTPSRNMSRPYELRARQGGPQVHLGFFATAEEAALHRARSVRIGELQPDQERVEPLAKGQVLEAALQDGLELVRSNNKTGYKNVNYFEGRYTLQARHGGRRVHLGHFATAQEAALARARCVRLNEPAPEQERVEPLTQEQALALAAQERGSD